MSELPVLHKNTSVFLFKTLDEWLSWLSRNFDKYPSGIWVKIAKKGSGVTSVSYEDVREGCLIYGLIDGLANKFDEKYYLLKVTPRRAKSVWSQINVKLVEEYIAQNKMKPSGLLEVSKAKADGRWASAYAPPSEMKMPEDFIEALKVNPDDFEFFDSLSKTNKYSFAFQLHNAKKPETRARRFDKLVKMVRDRQKIY